jgi:hypothetical protein
MGQKFPFPSLKTDLKISLAEPDHRSGSARWFVESLACVFVALEDIRIVAPQARTGSVREDGWPKATETGTLCTRQAGG